VTRPTETAVVVLSFAAFFAVVALAQTTPETFTATASVKNRSAQATADLSAQVQRYTSEEDRGALIKALREGGMAAVQKRLASMPDAGYIQLGQRKTPIKYAGRRPLPDGQLVTVITAEPIVFLGAGLPDAKPAAGPHVAVAILDVKNGKESWMGELAPAAKIGVDEGGALLIEDYGSTVVWLNRLVRAK
jgi:hypothetical protein